MMASLPTPSPAQFDGFARHICSAHSWYKHLPLEGGRFVVFLAPDAGAGYPLLHPRLGPGENSTELYRERFGFLDYLWRADPSEPFYRDGRRDSPALADWFLDRFGITLHPYASEDGVTVDALCGGHHRVGLERLKAGASHLAREQLLRMDELYAESQGLWRSFTDREREVVYSVEDEAPECLPSSVGRFIELNASCHSIHESLQAGELAKVRHALERLREWLTSAPL